MTIWTRDYFSVCFSNILITFPRFPSSSGTSKSCTRSVPHLAKFSNSYLSHTQEPPCRGSYQAQIIHSPVFYGDVQVLIHKLPLPTPEVQGGFDEAPAASVDPARVIPGAALWCCDCKGKKPKQRRVLSQMLHGKFSLADFTSRGKMLCLNWTTREM